MPSFGVYHLLLNNFAILAAHSCSSHSCLRHSLPHRSYVFLFNNGVILCKAKGPYYHFKTAIDFDTNELEVQDVPFLNGAQEERKVYGPLVGVVCGGSQSHRSGHPCC